MAENMENLEGVENTGAAESSQHFVKLGILQSRIRDRERQAALGRGLGALLHGRTNQNGEGILVRKPLPRLPLTDDGDDASGVHHGALLERIKGSHRSDTGAAMQALFHAMGAGTVPETDGAADGAPLASRRRNKAAISDGETTVTLQGVQFHLATDQTAVMMDLDLIHPNPFVPLSRILKEDLDRLILTIKAHGFLRPLVVMPSTLGDLVGSQTFWIISGERLWQAARILGIEQVPVRIHEVSPREAIQLVLVEDWHAASLPVMDRARLCGVLQEQMGMDIAEMRERLAVSEPELRAALRYLDLPLEMQESLNDGELSEDAAQALLEIEDERTRQHLYRYAIRFNWNAFRVRRAVQRRFEKLAA
jgi:ParB family chromosome partitioning protein